MANQHFIVKRNGKKEVLSFDKVQKRISSLAEDLNKIDSFKVSQKVISGLYDGISSVKIDELIAETSALLNDEHPEYGLLAGRITASSIHKETNSSFYQTMKLLYKDGQLSTEFINKVKKYQKELEKMIDYDRDFDFDFFGIKTLQGRPNRQAYLMRVGNKVVERPQHLFMRVAVAIADDNIKSISELYSLLSQGYYTHATPTLFNAGHVKNNYASCFLQQMEDDSIDGIFNTAKESALISKHAGGIGIHVSNLRGRGSKIRGNNGISNGLVPWMKIFNEVACSVSQGGKRAGSIAMYLEPWHCDVEEFLDMSKIQGPEELRARDLFTAMWMPDLFFQRCKEDEEWSLMCPDESKGLQDVYGEEFNALYEKYEKEGKFKKKIKARDLLAKIAEIQIEHGMPYILSKDAANKKSNQKNIGVVKSSNLCAEIMEVSTADETATCNLASICLSKFVKPKLKEIDHKQLERTVRVATRNLNNVIDRTFYPTDKTRVSNLKHRPIGIGVQGLADVFFQLGLAYDSEEALKIDTEIFETIYFAFLSESAELAKVHGPYESFAGSPASEGILQFDMWGVTPSNRHDWATLKETIKKTGLRNSLGVALMPTASTASIFGNTEAFEPIKGGIYKREVLSGEFILVNKYLVKALEKKGLWTQNIKNRILSDGGSVQGIAEIPDEIKEIFKTAYEIKQRVLIDHSAARGAFVDQSQSLNLFFPNIKMGQLTSAMMYGWEKGLKTLSYYIRSKSAAKGARVGEVAETQKESSTDAVACSIDNREDCDMCSS